MAKFVSRIFWNISDEWKWQKIFIDFNKILGASWPVFAPISLQFLSISGNVFCDFLWNFVKIPWAVSKLSGFANLTLICIFIELVVPQKFQMKDLLKGFQGVMNLAMFRWIFDPLQTFQKSAIFIALMVNAMLKDYFL